MAAPGVQTVERRLLALDHREFVAFLEALYSASGWSVAYEDPILHVERGGESKRLLVLPPRRLAPGLRRAPRIPVGGDDQDGVDDLEGLDGVVSPYRETDRSSLPRGTPAGSIVGAEELRDRLCYALDAEARDRLLREHLGIDPAAPGDAVGLTPLPAIRAPDSSAAAAGAVGVTLLLAGLLVLLAASGAFDPGSGSGTANASETEGAGAVIVAEATGYDVSQTCERGPREVVEVTSATLRGPEPGRGLVVAGRFWNPRATAGAPPGIWSEMMRAGDRMAYYNASSVAFSEPVIEGDEATVNAMAFLDGEQQEYAFELSRRSSPPNEGCWVIDRFEVV